MRGKISSHGCSVVEQDTLDLARDGRIWGFFREDADLDTGESLDTLIITGDKVLVVSFDVEAYGGQVLAYIDEETITSNDGTLHPMSCFDRVHPVPLQAKVYAAPTVVDVGNRFVTRRVLAQAQGNSGITTQVNSGLRRFLKPRTKYLLRQAAVSDNISLTLVGTMYEE